MDEATKAAERACVAAALLRPELIPEARVRRDHFHQLALGDIWATLESLHEAGGPIDLGTVASSSRHADLVLELAGGVVTGENIAFYGGQVREAALDRHLRVKLDELMRDPNIHGVDLYGAVQDVVAKAQVKSGRIGTEVRDGLLRTLSGIEKRYNEGGGLMGVRSGIAELDRYTSGIPVGVPMIIAARPGDGKSALALTICLNAALAGTVVDVFSLEDSREVVESRALAQHSGLNLMDVRSGKLLANQWSRLTQAAGELARVHGSGGPGKMMIADDIPRSVEELARSMEASAGRRGTQLVLVDYLQLLRAPSQRGRSRNDELTYAMGLLTRVARRCKLALVCTAQLRRDAEEAAAPRLSHIKDCGQIEQDCRAALLLQRRHGLTDDVGKPLDTVAVAYLEKNNHGPAPVRFPLHWDAKSVRFGDASDEEERHYWAAVRQRQDDRRRR